VNEWVLNPEWVRVTEEEKRRGWGYRFVWDIPECRKILNIGQQPEGQTEGDGQEEDE
jgi:hypothetical protein